MSEKIPADHPIQEIWENNKKSKFDLAREGDKDAIKTVLKHFRYHVHLTKKEWSEGSRLSHPNKYYRFDPAEIEYLIECFTKIIDGCSPNEAFSWTGKQAHPELTADEKRERAVIGSEVSRLCKKHGGGLSLTAAAKQVAKERNNISWQQAKACYEKYMKL